MQLTGRQNEIANLIKDEGFLNVDDLAIRFNVTAQTIRRDLNVLCDHGLARRRHGGVEPPSAVGNLAYQSRKIINTEAKRAIANAVAKRIPDGATIALSIGTTPELVAEALLGHDALKIVTNNLNVAMLTCGNPTFQVTIVGGEVRNSDRDVIGSDVGAFFERYRTDFGIFGVGGVEADGMLLDFEREEVSARQAILQSALSSFLVLDSSKFNRPAHVRGGSIEDVDIVFCEAQPPLEIVDRLLSSNVELVICGGELQ